jgi:hypothetical protein
MKPRAEWSIKLEKNYSISFENACHMFSYSSLENSKLKQFLTYACRFLAASPVRHQTVKLPFDV